MSNEARVGLLTIVALVILAGVLVFVSGPLLRERGYTIRAIFPSAEGVFPGTPVAIAGVQVGTVRAVQLSPDNRAEVIMRLRAGVTIPQGSTFTVASSGLLGDRVISIVPAPMTNPPLLPDAVVEGSPGFSIETLYARVDQVTQEVTALIASLGETVRSVNRIVGDPQLVASLQRTVANVESATARLEATIATDIPATTRNLRAMSASLVATAEALDRFVTQITDDPTMLRQVRETVAAVQRASRQVEQMAETARGVVNEEQAQKVRDTIAGAKQVVDDARALLGRVNAVIGSVEATAGGIRFPPAQMLRLEYELWYGGGRFRSDVEVFVAQSPSVTWVVGLRDLGGQNLLMLQRAALLTPTLAYRVGIVESQLGAGLDYRVDPRIVLGADLYNPTRLRLNLYARYALDQQWSVTLNVRGLLGEPYYGIGVRRRF